MEAPDPRDYSPEVLAKAKAFFDAYDRVPPSERSLAVRTLSIQHNLPWADVWRWVYLTRPRAAAVSDPWPYGSLKPPVYPPEAPRVEIGKPADVRESVIPGYVKSDTEGPTLVIGDTHIPFVHPEYRDFCLSVQKKYGCTNIVHIGDCVDQHALSYHEHDPDGHSAGYEAELAVRELKNWYQAFPEVNVMVGNHAALPFRKALTNGLPKRYLKTFEEIWEAPAGWKWMINMEKDGVLYTHGTGNSGKNAALTMAIERRQSVVIGHVHSYGGVQYTCNGKSTIFGLNAGCGVDMEAYSMNYARDYNRQPTLGCGVVTEGGKVGIFVPMI